MIQLFKWILEAFTKAQVNPAATVSLVLKSGYDADKPIQRDPSFQLSEHFSLGELTVTSNAALQGVNRLLSDTQLQKLTKLARHAEGIRRICGLPVRIHSGFRSLALNGATAGSSKTSQHPKCEAIDFDIIGMSLEDAFTKLRAEAAAGRFVFGQLILECAQRDYGTSRWLHCSVIGTMDQSKVGQVLTMVEKDGIYVYELVEQIKFEGLTLP